MLKDSLTLRKICEVIGIDVPDEFVASQDNHVTCIAAAPRYVQAGCAFFCRRGDIEEEYVRKAYRDGCSYIFSRKQYLDEAGNPLPCILVPSPIESLIKISSAMRRDFPGKIVCVTGSLGKTTTKDIIYTVLKAKYNALRSFGNENIVEPIVKNIQRLDSSVDFLVQETGTGAVNLLPSAARMLQADMAVFTNISDPHVDVFGTRERILEEKLSIVRYMQEDGIVFLNKDDRLLRDVVTKQRRVFFALEDKSADYTAGNIVPSVGKISFEITCKAGVFPIELHAYGEHNVYNAVAAFAVASESGMSPGAIQKALSKYRTQGIRQAFHQIAGYNLYLDCYNSAPISLIESIRTIAGLPLPAGAKRIAVLGDMFRLGSESDYHHADCARQIGQYDYDVVLFFGDYWREHYHLAQNGKSFVAYAEDRQTLNQLLKDHMTPGDLILFKGPVPRLLSKSVDQVFGTSFHLDSEKIDRISDKQYRLLLVGEKHVEDPSGYSVAVIGYTGRESDLSLPAVYKDIAVTHVYKNSFAQSTALRKVQFPPTCYNIGEKAFDNCVNLETVLLPSALKMIEKYAFRGCSALKSIELPAGVTDLGDGAFKDCSRLKELTIPRGLRTIGEGCFAGCGKLTLKIESNDMALAYAKSHGIKFKLGR